MGRRRGSSPYFYCGGCDRKGGDRDKRLRFPPESTVYWPTPLLCHHPVSPPPPPPSLPSLSLPQAVEELSPHCPPPNRCTHKGECEGRGGDGFQKAPSMMAPGRFQCERERERARFFRSSSSSSSSFSHSTINLHRRRRLRREGEGESRGE